jgi:hypothetical protein
MRFLEMRLKGMFQFGRRRGLAHRRQGLDDAFFGIVRPLQVEIEQIMKIHDLRHVLASD